MRICAGKTALVTSASGAVGRAVAIALGEAGAQVLIQHSRSPVVAERIVDRIRTSGGRAKAVAVDLASVEGPYQLAHQARTIIGDRLDILVINAKLPGAVDLKRLNHEFFDRVFAANVRAPLFLVQQLLPVMKQGSCLVFSLTAPAMPADDPAASVIRGGLDGLVSQLITLLKARGIRVDALIPTLASGIEGFAATFALLPQARRHSQGSKGVQRPADIARAVAAIVCDVENRAVLGPERATRNQIVDRGGR